MTASTLEEPAVRLSWSRLRLHDECPAKGALMRAHQSPLRNIRSWFHGTVCDTAMRRWLDMDDPPPGWLAANIDAIFDECLKSTKETGDGIVRWRTPTDRDETREFCRELVARLDPLLARYVLPFTWWPAQRFTTPVAVQGRAPGTMRSVLLVGEMDLLLQDSEGRWIILDLKATRDNHYYRKVLGQLAFYSLALQSWKGSLPYLTGLIQPMCDQQMLPVQVTEQARREMMGRIERVAHDIWSGNLAPKASDGGCNFCEVQHACPKFAPPPHRRLAAA